MARSTSRPGPVETAGDVVAAGLRRQVAELRRWEAELRLGHPDAVHRYRIAARRLRSNLRAFRPFFGPGAVASLDGDLGRAAARIGVVRDAEVVGGRLRELLDQLQAEADEGLVADVRRCLGGALDHSSDAGSSVGAAHFNTPEYDQLVRRLEAFVDLPPWSPAAMAAAEDSLHRVLREEWARFRRRGVRPVAGAGEGLQDGQLHRARKAAKRVRYVAEELEPLFGRQASKLAKTAARLQNLLGDYQDSVITQRLLEEVAERCEDPASTAALRQLALLELDQRLALRGRLDELLSFADKKSLRRWLR